MVYAILQYRRCITAAIKRSNTESTFNNLTAAFCNNKEKLEPKSKIVTERPFVVYVLFDYFFV
jgi:hypothetical protein